MDDAKESDSDGFDSQHEVEFRSNYIKPNVGEAGHTTTQELNVIGVESRSKGDTENIETEKT